METFWKIVKFVLASAIPVVLLLFSLDLLTSVSPTEADRDFYYNNATVEGKVTKLDDQSIVLTNNDGSSDIIGNFRTAVKYEVNGQSFEVVKNVLEQRSVGDSVKVYYNLHNPSQADLAEPLSPTMIVMLHLVFGILFLLVGGGLLGFIVYRFFLEDVNFRALRRRLLARR